MTVLAGAGATAAVVTGPVRLWYRDLISCLQGTFATVFDRAGHDPLEVLGSHWEFRYIPGDVRPEEFYYPCRHPGDLARSLAPHHPVGSRWGRPADPAAPLVEIAAELAADRPVIAAVDNFYLPFRPAFGDVHAAHLILVWGLDERRGLVHVADAMPPAFSGPLPITDFLRAWGSANPPDVQDAFFSDARIDRRYLTVTLGEPFPVLDAGCLRRVLTENLGLAGDDNDADAWCGTTGLRRFLDDLVGRARSGDARALADAYPFGWGMQAQASLHGELLRRWGARHRTPAVREAGRLVERVAHVWTGVRVTAAHGRRDPAAAAGDLARHARVLRQRYEQALDGLRDALEEL
jgi:hypothetical protein